MELAIIWVRVMSGTEKAPAIDGQGKLAERNETSSSALPALQHLLGGGLMAEHPLVALPTFWVLFIQKFARRAKAPKFLIYFEPGARNRRPTTDVGALKMRQVLCLMNLTAWMRPRRPLFEPR